MERIGFLGQGVGDISSTMGELHARLDEMRRSMVTRGIYNRFFERIRQLEVGVEAAERTRVGGEPAEIQADSLGEHSADIDDDRDEEYYNYYGRDGNYVESESEQVDCED